MSTRIGWLLPIAGLTLGILAVVLWPLLTQQAKQASHPTQTILLNAHVIPMTDESVYSEHAVVVEGDRILGIYPADAIPLADNATIIDCRGAFLIPGLADMHMHTWTDWVDDDYAVCPLELYIANGVTTIRCLGPGGGDPTYILDWRNDIAAGRRVGPTIYTSGDVLNSPLTNPSATVRSQSRNGFDFIKPYSFLTRDDFQAIMVEAERLNLYSVGHLPYSMSLAGALAAGLDEIAHIEELAWELITFNRNQDLTADEWTAYVMEMVLTQHADALSLSDEQLAERYGPALRVVAEQLVTADASASTTLVVGDTIATKLLDPAAFLARPGADYLSRSYMVGFLNGRDKHQTQLQGVEVLAQFKRSLEALIFQEMHRAGVRLVAGTDAGTGVLGLAPGFSLHDELSLLVEYGLTPYEALAACTRTAGEIAARMTGQQEFGTIEAGLRADLVLVAENPLTNPGALANIQGVMSSGRWYEEAAIEEMLRIPADDRPAQLRSSWTDHPVTLDGRMSDDDEWAAAESLDLSLLEANTGPDTIPSTWWMMNDADWLYVLVRIPAHAIDVSAASIAYFWSYPFPTQSSDYTWIDTQGGTWDACQFNFETWRWTSDTLGSPSGTDHVEGASARIGGSRWFEFRKPLSSGDDCDWSFVPGNSYGVNRTGPLNLGVIPANSGGYFERGITLHLASAPSL